MVITCSLLVVTLYAQTSLNALYNEFARESNASNVNLKGLAMMFGKPFLDNNSDSKISGIRVLSLDECTQEVKDRFNENALKFRDDSASCRSDATHTNQCASASVESKKNNKRKI